MPDCALASRHLGLITAAEVEGLQEKILRLAGQMEESVDLDTLFAIAASAPPLTASPVSYTHLGDICVLRPLGRNP